VAPTHETIRNGLSYFRELPRHEATIFRSMGSDVIDASVFFCPQI
jgi:hypothetical protein